MDVPQRNAIIRHANEPRNIIEASGASCTDKLDMMAKGMDNYPHNIRPSRAKAHTASIFPSEQGPRHAHLKLCSRPNATAIKEAACSAEEPDISMPPSFRFSRWHLVR